MSVLTGWYYCLSLVARVKKQQHARRVNTRKRKRERERESSKQPIG